MALQLSAKAKLLTQRRNVTPNLILEIDGVPTLYSSIDTLRLIRYGDPGIYYGMPGLYYGGGIVDENIKSLVAIDGSGNSLKQQILQDKGAVSGVTSFQIELIDENSEISNLISPGLILDDLLSTKARVYINFKDGAHPEDSVLIHRGIIDNIEPQAASVKLTIASPEQLKRQELFPKTTTKLNGSINNSVTTITVDSTDNFISPYGTELESYIKIEDELIKWTSKSATQFIGCTRGQLGTVSASHADNEELETFYRLKDNAIDLALKLMLSGGALNYAENIGVENLGALSPIDIRPSVIFFNYFDIQSRYGLVVGDFVTVTGSGIGGNNQANLVITGFDKSGVGSWIEVDGTFTQEFNSPAVVSFKSKYNVLGYGMKMTPEDVDVARHEDITDRFSNSIPDYDFYLKDEIKADEFLSKEVYFPAGLFSIPRKTKASVGISIPPIADDEVVEIDDQNIVSPSKLKSQRSTNKNFYNSVNYKYNELATEDKFVNGKINLSADSVSRFPNIGNKPLTIVSKGLRDDSATEVLIRLNSRRLLERYQFASELIPGIKVLFSDAFTIEVGDVIVFGSPELKMTDLSKGNRDFQQKLYEVINKNLNVKTGEATIDLLATNFELDGRYGIVSPSSYTDSGSTTTQVMIKNSFSTVSPEKEKTKWQVYIGQTILVRSKDWSYQEETTLVSFSPTNDFMMIVDPPLSSAPPADYIIDIPKYPASTDPELNNKYKILHCFFDPQVVVTSGTSNTVFDVGIGDITKFFVGSVVRIHNDDFSIYSIESVITYITGTTLTVEDALGFTPSTGQFVELIGFPDEGKPYRLL